MHELGDFTTERRVLIITAIAIGIGVVAAYVTKGLLALIALFTNIFFYGRFTFASSSPVGNHLGLFVIVIPVIFVREVMRTNTVAIAADTPIDTLRQALHAGPDRHPQRLYPVVTHDRVLAGVVTRRELQTMVDSGAASVGAFVADTSRTPTVAYPDEPLRVVVYRMAGTGLTRFPVVERGPNGRLVGMIALTDLLVARTKNLEAEERRERVFALPRPFRSTPVS